MTATSIKGLNRTKSTEPLFFQNHLVQIKILRIFAVQNNSVGPMNRELKAKLKVLELNRGIEQYPEASSGQGTYWYSS
jgi:hypothetical protein